MPGLVWGTARKPSEVNRAASIAERCGHAMNRRRGAFLFPARGLQRSPRLVALRGSPTRPSIVRYDTGTGGSGECSRHALLDKWLRSDDAMGSCLCIGYAWPERNFHFAANTAGCECEVDRTVELLRNKIANNADAVSAVRRRVVSLPGCTRSGGSPHGTYLLATAKS
jgi:hypothetical protein